MMEMLCASVCITSIICFTLEKKFRNVRAMDEAVHANQYRMGYRGNATSFPLPWEDLMVQLKDSQAKADAASAVSLPRVGMELANVVSVLLKSAGGSDGNGDDFGGADLDGNEIFNTGDDNVFHEIAVLPVDLPQVTTQQVICRPFASELLPDSVYMLVDKTVELDPRPLSEFPELGVLNPEELVRQALCLYSSPRSAKRQCGRSQRVIKVPDTKVFESTSRHLLARGITRLLLEGALYSLDA